MNSDELDLDFLLYPHQADAVERMKNGCILCGGVGTGKSRTALVYYILNESSRPLYIITTARKRDTRDWEEEISRLPEGCFTEFYVNSWNNIQKYAEVKDAFFIFDEQRVVGYGAWVKAFLKIARKNDWILLSATPGDTWSDYIPVFIANGFYKNKRDFTEKHIVYNTFITKYPKIDHYISQGVLMKHRRDIVVNMEYLKSTKSHDEYVYVPYDKALVKHIMKDRWNPYTDEPIQETGGLCYILRRAVNSDERRFQAVYSLLASHPKSIVFYNFDYELEGLRALLKLHDIPFAEWNGHRHEPIPSGDKWVYLVQYTAGAEGWNCVETDTIIFFSQNYSYRIMVQSAGRIDRLNTSFRDLYYFHLLSHAPIDLAIRQALDRKEDFNERTFHG